jgi:ribonuclease D
MLCVPCITLNIKQIANKLGQTITKEEIAAFPMETFCGHIVEVQNADEADRAVAVLRNYPRLGFDTETRPSFKKGPMNPIALIQLSAPEVCFLFRLNRIGFTPSLIALLCDPNISKIGLSLRDDFQSMGRRMKFKPKGFIDLQGLMPNYGIDELSLQKIYALLFRKRISKSQRLTNWEALSLSESQKQYAALDAWACLKIYEELCL